MTDFLIASNNNHKIYEFKRILLPLGINVVSANDVGFNLGEVEENGETFADNAYIKAISAFKKTNMPSVADDSGLCVDALGGAPGVYTARYGGENLTQTERNNLLLQNMKDIPKDDRKARFVCSICCVIGEDDIIRVEGLCEGSIAMQTEGEGGFGYDPIFLGADGRCFGVISDDEKDKLSHRGNALRKLCDALSKRKDLI